MATFFSDVPPACWSEQNREDHSFTSFSTKDDCVFENNAMAR